MKDKKLYLIIIFIVVGLIIGSLKGGNTSVRGDGLLSLFPEKVQEFFN